MKIKERLTHTLRTGTAVLFAAGFLCPGARGQAADAPAGKPRLPSIVFVLADDLGYGDLGCFGQRKIKTPNLDRLAAQGMVFTSCYAGSTVCAPSRAALMTGKHTGHARIRGNARVFLQPEDVTLAQVLKSAGYVTGAIGKWGLGDAGTAGVPRLKGFDEWFGYLNQTDAHNYYPTALNRSNARGAEADITIMENLDGRQGTYSQDFFTSVALNFLRINQPDEVNSHRPFFLYLAYTIPHANNEITARTGNGMQVPTDAPYSGESWPQVEKNKAAMITRLDADVGKLMGKLDELKIAKNTIFIFTSDNGPHKEGGVDPKFFQSAGPLRGIKRDLYEGGIRVPLIVRWPFFIPPGRTNDTPIAFWDFLPTFAELARRAPPPGIDGLSFGPTFRGETQTNRHEFLYWEFHENGFHQAVRMGDWKGVRHGVDGPLELYDLRTDPAEKRNVAAENPKEAAQIEDYLKTARTDDPRWPARTVAQNQGGAKAPADVKPGSPPAAARTSQP